MDNLLINPYSERGLIRDPEKFYGRQRELREVYSLLATMQSVSVVGERRIGKSSFLYRIAHPPNDELNGTFTLRFLDLQRVFSAEEFYQRACKELDYDGQSHRDLEEAVRGRQVVFCLDEFEQAYKEDFGSEFFNALRSLASMGELSLVVATQQPLDELHRLYRQDEDVTSKFHNIFTRLTLDKFTAADARALVATPRPGHEAFKPSEVERILQLAGTHPYHLNLACALAYEARAAEAGLQACEDFPAERIDFAKVVEQFRAEIVATAPKIQPPSAADAQASVDQPTPRPLADNQRLASGASLNPIAVAIAALLFLLGAFSWSVAGQSSREWGISALIFFFLALVILVAETFRFARHFWRMR